MGLLDLTKLDLEQVEMFSFKDCSGLEKIQNKTCYISSMASQFLK